MMKQCGFAILDTDQEVLFCKHGGPCSKRLQFGECPLMSRKVEKSFDAVYIGKCFRIDAKEPGEYSRKDCTAVFPASSLELVDPESDRLDAIEQRLDGIEKRLQPPEGKANNDTSDEMPELHVGNYVEIVGQPFVVSGLPVGTIDRVSYQAPFGWFTLEGSEAWYPLRSLRKLSDDEIIAKIGRERKA